VYPYACVEARTHLCADIGGGNLIENVSAHCIRSYCSDVDSEEERFSRCHLTMV